MAELEHQLSAKEFAEWQAYSRIEPFGERRADQRAWLIVSMLANIHRDPAKTKAIKLDEVLPEWRPPVDPMDAWRAFAAQMDRLAVQ